jgi:predicted component of type VI protein secretion system
LTHAELSKFHCGLLRTREGAWVIDCLGRGGTRVNGQTVRWAFLEDGDEIRVGQFVLRVRYGSSAGEAEAAAVSSGALARIPSRPPLPSTTAVLPASSLSDSLKAELVEPYLAHLTSQFGQMQQQMFDQFQQAMMQMAQVFGTLHRDQTALVRDELARLRQLNQELTVLHAELTARSAGAAAPPAIAAADADAAPAATSAALSRIEALLHAALPGPAGPGSQPEQAASPSVPDNGSHGAIVDGSTPTGLLSPAMHPVGSNDDWIHEHLSRRIAALQEERQGRWQKILGLMSDR